MTLNEEERRLLSEEDSLISQIQTRGVTDETKQEARSLARAWKVYSQRRRDEEQNAPKLKTAIKHCLALLPFANGTQPHWKPLQEVLEYGRDNILSIKPKAYEFPILEAKVDSSTEMIGVLLFGKITPFRLNKRKGNDLERISCCGACDAEGTCNLIGICVSYNQPDYDAARIAKLGPKKISTIPDPTPEDFKTFARYKP